MSDSLIEDPRSREEILAGLHKSAEMYEKAAARAAPDPALRPNLDNLLDLARRRRDAIAALEGTAPTPATLSQETDL